DHLYYLFTDHLGSTSEVRLANGTLHSRQYYRAFGEERYTSGALPTDRTYTSQREIENGLVHYGARTYDPLLARWIQPDSIIPESSQGIQAWDRYAYVNNSPLNYSDPTGHFFTSILIGAGIGALIGGAVNIIQQVKSAGCVSDWKDVVSAAAGGAVSGAVMSIAPITGIGAAFGYGAISNVLSEQTNAIVDAILEPSGKGLLNDFSANGGFTNGEKITNTGEIISDAIIGGALNGAAMGIAHSLSKVINISDPFQVTRDIPYVINILPNDNLLGIPFELVPISRNIVIEKSVISSFLRPATKVIKDAYLDYANQVLDEYVEW
ncbi:MAG TPA: RHS repeat-associated core domain-containing protein, partial [Anaerolineaceae bacterium]